MKTTSPPTSCPCVGNVDTHASSYRSLPSAPQPPERNISEKLMVVVARGVQDRWGATTMANDQKRMVSICLIPVWKDRGGEVLPLPLAFQGPDK